MRPGATWETIANDVAWELLYRKEPDLYERLVAGEHLHQGILDWLPAEGGRVIEVGAGTGRLTIPLAAGCSEMIAVEPALQLRQRLTARLVEHGHEHVDVVHGFFDPIPVESGWADLCVSCSAFTPDERHGGEKGLEEMERVTRPDGIIAIVWPQDAQWLEERGFTTLSFEGQMHVEFDSVEEAVEIARVFYPWAAEQIATNATRKVAYEQLRMEPPNRLCFREVR